MKTLTLPARLALQAAYRFLPGQSVCEALKPYQPVGWCAAIQRQSGPMECLYDGFSVLPETKVRENTIFRVASVSKILVSAAAMLLVRRGLLALDEDIFKTLGFSARKTVTLRQLLTHTASLSDRGAYHRVFDAERIPPLETVVAESFLPYAPGTRFLYSSLGTGIVGMAIETVTGMFMDDFIQKEFFMPFGIDASFHPQRIQDKARLSNCYRAPENKLSYDAHRIASLPLDEKPDPSHHYLIPAGKLMISAPDLLMVLQHISNEMPELFVLQNHVGSVQCACGRGLGMAYMPKNILSSHSHWGHQGVAYGALCEAWLCHETKTVAVLLTNGIRLTRFSPLYRAGQAGMAALLRHAAR